MGRFFFLLFTVSFLGVACTVPRGGLKQDGAPAERVQTGMRVPGPEGENVEEMVVVREGDSDPKSGGYRSFTIDVIGNGEPSVLYFKADWCPKCVAQHAKFQQSYDFPLTTYYVDYDSSSELKSRYGVVQQHTFVKIDGNGEKIRMLSFPSEEQLAAFLSE